MRTTYSVFATLLLSAVPSVSSAQIVVPHPQHAGPVIARLDHVIPVAKPFRRQVCRSSTSRR